MHQFELPITAARPVVLLLGAHSDDIEIGCGGTLLRFAQRHRDARYVWVTLSADDARARETEQAAALFLEGTSGVDLIVQHFKGSYFPHQYDEIKDFFETLKSFSPDVVFTHSRLDLHQDHRVTHELTWNTFRDHVILEYEIPKFEGDLGQPNTYVPLTREQVARKCELLMQCFASQHARPWFSPETFTGLARLRGIECNAAHGFAEAFYVRKVSLAI
jgi:LmbE family N-acetylglucosaminyl deacetylase